MIYSNVTLLYMYVCCCFPAGAMMNHGHRLTVPGWSHREIIATAAKPQQRKKMEDDCNIIETRPTFLVSNDDIFNLG